jgi:hypothetical protein
MPAAAVDFDSLPGGDLVAKGLEDLRSGASTIESLLVEIGAPRLRSLGLDVPASRDAELPEHRLYRLLAAVHGDAAHSRYNALVRRLVSFERTLACVSRPAPS